MPAIETRKTKEDLKKLTVSLTDKMLSKDARGCQYDRYYPHEDWSRLHGELDAINDIIDSDSVKENEERHILLSRISALHKEVNWRNNSVDRYHAKRAKVLKNIKWVVSSTIVLALGLFAYLIVN